ncbi:MAG: 2-oxoglutarate dehydrogenase complex dihydrolipoyllysine-residue succinyltransferase [Alphaproteobacteria bacterium]|nr:2-oxoglutarate dehydrogenase complex dihydrolipoyllysine-residue succinyltransferase [Alphaproteobacteria bacterium]MCB9793888.1 2-oxoglutarate dehydrogenase complex dihydrolipoyllysine-residue succinyltransferase [Alphaproteobacteria bacterium]
MPTDLNIPQVGESITTVFIARWIAKPGQAVKAGESVLEIDSDKASMEVPSPVDGVVQELLAEAGDEVEIGAVVARIAEGPGNTGITGGVDMASKPESAAQAAPSAAQAEPERPAAGRAQTGPAARQQAAKSGVNIDAVEGTGTRGRVLAKDVRAAAASVAPTEPIGEAPEVDNSGLVEVVPMSPLRRTIARRLVEAQQTAAMLTTFNEVDLTAVKEMRAEHQDRFVKRYGIKLGFMSFFVKAVIEALKEYPAVNAEIRENHLLYKRYYNIGVAVSGPKGLVVPVVKGADRLSFAETEQAISELATRARDNKLRMDDFADGTFTISNGGVFGSLMSTPILNPPQVGILGMHAIQDRPMAVNGKVEIRPMMYLALSYDHRIIDGREAVSFLRTVKEQVEDPARILLGV